MTEEPDVILQFGDRHYYIWRDGYVDFSAAGHLRRRLLKYVHLFADLDFGKYLPHPDIVPLLRAAVTALKEEVNAPDHT